MRAEREVRRRKKDEGRWMTEGEGLKIRRSEGWKLGRRVEFLILSF
jgi:hypothetical protein